MIKEKFINDNLKKLYEDVFGDTKDFLTLYFNEVIKDENCIVYCDESKIVSAIQVLPKNMIYFGNIIPCDYITYLATDKKYRNNGFASNLINKANRKSYKDGVIFSTLLPAEFKLNKYYEKFGYADIMTHVGYNDKSIDLTFKEFDRLQRESGNMILHDEKWFNLAKIDLDETKNICKDNISASIKIINAEKALKLFVKNHTSLNNIKIKVTDDIIEENNCIFEINNQEVTANYSAIDFDCELSIYDLTKILLKVDNLKMQWMLCSGLTINDILLN